MHPLFVKDFKDLYQQAVSTYQYRVMNQPLVQFVLTIIIAFTSSFHLTTEAQNTSWTSHGPDGGRIAAISMSATNPDILYAGTVAGIYKTENGGDEWHKTNFPGYYYVTSIKVHPADPDLVLAGTKGSGVYRSENGGLSWKYMGLWEYTINHMDTDPNDPDLLYFGTGEAMTRSGDGIGIYRITDGWTTGGPMIFWDNWGECGWTKVNRVIADPDSSGWIYAAGINSGYCSNFGGVLISQDSGKTWDDKKDRHLRRF